MVVSGRDVRGGFPHLRCGAEDSWAVAVSHSVLVGYAVLEAAGVIFFEENGEGPGVRLREAVADAD